MGTTIAVIVTFLVVGGIGWLARKSWGLAFGPPPPLPRSLGQHHNEAAADEYYRGRPHVVSAQFLRRTARGPARKKMRDIEE